MAPAPIPSRSTHVLPGPVRSARTGRAGRAAVALVALSGVVLSACGGSDSGGGGNPAGTVAPSGAQSAITVAAAGKPKPGGELTYALEAEIDGFAPTKNRWAISGVDMGLAVYDPIAAVDDTGKAQPYLAEKWEPSADYKTWKITMRSGITFHNGEPLNAEAVKLTYDAHRDSFLTGAALTNIDKVSVVSDLVVQFDMKESWATFPSTLVGQVGVIPAPEQLKMESGGPQNPIGTGPFKLASRTPDKETVFEKNPSYWRKDKDGVQLPYLNKVTFFPTPDNDARVKGLQSGQFDVIHTSDGPSIIKLREDAAAGKVQKIEDEGESEEGFVMLNLAKAPFDDLRVRKAMAMAIDRQAYVNGPGNGVNRVADNVFSENSPWYVKVDYPAYDPAAASELVNQYEAEKGPIKFTLRGGGDGIRQQLELLQQWFTAVGMEVETGLVEQTTFIVQALGGQFDANIWRQWGEVDPDQDYFWWIGENAKPIGESSLNIGRLKNDKVDAALRKGRGSTDIAVRKEAYAEVQKAFTEDLPYLWLDHSTWMLAAKNDVRDLTNGPLPSGDPSIPIGGTTFPGTHRITQVWLDR